MAQLVLVMTVVLTLSGLGLFVLGRVEQRHVRAIVHSEEEALGRTLAHTVALRSETMGNYVADYSLWNDMASFAQKPDPEWAKVNVDASLLSFKLDRSWVFDRTGALRYTTGSRVDEQLPGAPEGLKGIFSEGPFVHYFARGRDGSLVEIRGSLIQREDDRERTSEALGYFFAAKLWDARYVEGLEPLLGGSVAVLDASSSCDAGAGIGKTRSDLVVDDARGSPVARVCAAVPNPVAELMLGSRATVVRGFLAFAIVLIAIVVVSLRFFVTRPLRVIHGALAGGDREGLEHLRTKKSELAELADLVVRYEESVEARRVLQEQVHHAGKMASLGILGAGMAHEINNPLAVVIGYADMLTAPDRGGMTAAEVDQGLKTILAAAERMKCVVERVRDFSREGPSPELKLRPINEIVERALLFLKGDIDRCGIDVALDLADSLPPVACDEMRLESAVQNLVANARDALGDKEPGERKTISIRTERNASGDRVSLIVEDNGSGIPKEVQSHLFEPFFTTKDVGKGTGLGLAIVHSIATEHGGTISFTSTPSRGTKFVLELPV